MSLGRSRLAEEKLVDIGFNDGDSSLLRYCFAGWVDMNVMTDDLGIDVWHVE
ncbi:hypothetical protein L3X38_003838 [Prunus dulcis]|uniref:Uncharacterized protein n=1 Tax=Prunus dulcis TaxID=3755 RepID=A0AAD4ZMT2_PRUDU|nr:hypothetical protein L3X38_003838 [Prunus dulcis]